jgi:hypothetical protein
VAVDFHADDARVFYLGFRFGSEGDSSGAVFTFDLDIGFRPRLYEGTANAVSFVVGGGVGGAYFATTLGSSAAFHLPLRVGPCFDFGTFTFEVLFGPALYAEHNAVGAFEGITEFGARF